MKSAKETACSMMVGAIALGCFQLSTAHAAAVVQAEPAVVKAVPPSYPRAAERRSIEGSVTVSIDVNADGSVAAVNVVSADPAGIFDTAAIKAVQRWKFEKDMPAQGVLKTIRFKVQG
ncbi:MAG: energy transducer TonB [Parvularculaceae bacterium]|nr:energy transducer TonB [Parvularculaceae bacterium]